MGHGDVDETLAVPGVSLVILAHSPETVKPAEGSLHDPALWE
jgi:hypothetical protein